MKCNRWLLEEDEILKSLYGKVKIEHLVPKFPRHTQGSIYKRAKKLGLKGDNSLAQKKYTIDQDFFCSGSLESCYWAGFLAADGYIAKDNGVRLGLARKDEQHIFNFIKSVNYNGPVRRSQTTNTNGSISLATVVDIWGVQKWHQDLSSIFNITPKKSLTLKPPCGLNNEQSLAFIIGYLDGDGCIRKISKNSIAIDFCGTKAVMKWIKNILDNNFKIVSGGVIRKHTISNIYYLHYYGKNAKSIGYGLLNINCQNRLERKWIKIREVDYLT